jgi:hypothetical protein
VMAVRATPRGADFDYNDMAMKLGIGEWFV